MGTTKHRLALPARSGDALMEVVGGLESKPDLGDLMSLITSAATDR
jgi:hypothetical protein